MFISPQRRRRRQQSLLSPDVSPQPSPLAYAASAASKARTALAPGNEDADYVESLRAGRAAREQPDAFKAFLNVSEALPVVPPPVSKPQTRGEMKRFQRVRNTWESGREEREAARVRREQVKKETEVVAQQLVDARALLEATLRDPPQLPPSCDAIYAQVQARRAAAEKAVAADEANAPPVPPAASAYPPMPTKAPSKLPFGGAPAPAKSAYPPMPTKAPSKLPFGAPAPAPATFGFGCPAAAPAPKATLGFAAAAPAPATFGGFGSGAPAFGSPAARPAFGSASALGAPAFGSPAARAAAAPAFGSPAALGSKPAFGSPAALGAPTFGAASALGVPAFGTPPKEDHRAKLVAFYEKHNPAKLSTVDATLAKYNGREAELFGMLRKKYSEEAPPATGAGPRCFLQLEKDGTALGRLVIQLFADKVPNTAENFRRLCEGAGASQATWAATKRSYENTSFHRVISGFMAQGGDFTRGDGTGGEAADGGKFADEPCRMRHDRRGLLSMANSGPSTNGSQFFLLLAACRHLDGKHVVFGEVVEGLALLDAF